MTEYETEGEFDSLQLAGYEGFIDPSIYLSRKKGEFLSKLAPNCLET